MFALRNRNEPQAKPEEKQARADSARHGEIAGPERNAVWQSLALRPAFLQPKLTVSQPGDADEQEADRIADQVMRMPAPSSSSFIPVTRITSGHAQRKCSGCEEEDEKLHRKEDGASGGASPPASSRVHETLSSPGQPLDASARAFFEPRFGRDFGDVRVHTDARAAASARSVSALAYTVGRNIVFGAGQYAPGASGGRRLLAHELSHVAQQAVGVLQRTPDPTTLAEFDKRVEALKKHKAYKRLLGWGKKKLVQEIIDEARKRDNALYYIEKLELLFNTPEEKASEQAAAFSKTIEDASTAEAARLADKTKQGRAGAEEAVSKDPSRVYSTAVGEGGKTFEIDARDPTDIAIRAKVRLVRAGKGKKEDVLRIKTLEDAIEKHITMLGYSVDLDFVDKRGKDVFSVDVDTSEWTTSGNWVGNDEALAHELHHLLGLGDRYDYIESHSANEQMKIPDRIYWFREEMRKVTVNDPASIMHDGKNLPLDDDICMVAGFKTKTDIDACVKKRTEARDKKIAPSLVKASDRAYKAHQILAGSLSPDPSDVAGKPTQSELKQKQAMSVALSIFGKPVTLKAATDTVFVINFELGVMLSNIYLASEMTKACDKDSITTRSEAPSILLCPSFFNLAVPQQADALTREAAHQGKVGNAAKDSDCSTAGCDVACGDDTNAHAWVRFIGCIEGL